MLTGLPARSSYRFHPRHLAAATLPVFLGLVLGCSGKGSDTAAPAPASSDAASVTVDRAGTSPVVSPSTATVAAGGTQGFTATVAGSTGSGITWAVDGIPNGNSTVGTIATGQVAARLAASASAPSLRKAYNAVGVTTQTVAVQAGDLVAVTWVVGNTPGTTICTDSDGNTYKPMGNPFSSNGIDASGYGFYTVAQKADSNLQVKITSQDTNSLELNVLVIQGLSTDLNSVLDAAAVKSEATSAGSHTSGSLKTTMDGDFLVALWGQDYKRATLKDNGTGFTLGTQYIDGSCTAYKVAGAAGTYSAAVTSSSAVALGSIVAAFKPAASSSTVSSATYTAPAAAGNHTRL